MIPVKQEGSTFIQELCIPCYQTDSKGLLKPTAFMDIAQEIAYWAAEGIIRQEKLSAMVPGLLIPEYGASLTSTGVFAFARHNNMHAPALFFWE